MSEWKILKLSLNFLIGSEFLSRLTFQSNFVKKAKWQLGLHFILMTVNKHESVLALNC